MLDNASERRVGRGGARASGGRRGHRAGAPARQGARTTARCCSARAGATRCCSTRTPSCSPARPRRCTPRSSGDPRAGAAGARAPAPRRRAAAVGVALPDAVATALAGALFLHRRLTVQSRGEATREVDWAQSAALLVRREAAARDRLVRPARSSSTPTRSTSAAPARRRLARRSTCPAAAPSTTSSSRPGRVPERRIVELVAQPRPLHAQAPLAPAPRAPCAGSPRGPTRCARSPRSSLPGHDPRRYWRHVTATLAPGRGEGLREAAAGVQPPRATAAAARAPAARVGSPARGSACSHSAAGSSASASARSTKPPAPSVGSSSSPATATPPTSTATAARAAPTRTAPRTAAA